MGKEVKEGCMTCKFYHEMTPILGYCLNLAIIVEDKVAVLDQKERIESIEGSNQTVYRFPLVPYNFGCVYHELNKRIVLL